ncbi:Ferrous iron transport protein B, partial [Bacillus anthracis]
QTCALPILKPYISAYKYVGNIFRHLEKTSLLGTNKHVENIRHAYKTLYIPCKLYEDINTENLRLYLPQVFLLLISLLFIQLFNICN